MKKLAGPASLALIAALISLPALADRNCAWEARFDPSLVNTAYPDQFANYWILALPAVPGSSLTVHGVYPHARYMSFVSYAATLQSADGLPDTAIEPDPGSDNPFRAGHARNTSDSVRHYTVRVKFLKPGKAVPAVRQPNTLYTSNADGSKRGQMFTVIYRVYRPDAAYGEDITGGVGLPSVTYNAPGGASIELPTCPYPEIPPTGVNERVANAGGSNSGSGTVQHPGFNPPVWHKFQNFARSFSQGATENEYWGTTFSDALKPVADALPRGGYADNPDNNYIFALLSHGHGQIAVFRAKLPTTPNTYPDAAVMPGGQLRYWSMCSNDGPSQRFFGCVMDDGVAPTLAEDGTYTIVVSTPPDRPSSVTDGSCSCVWLPWGPGPSVAMIMRNMLPDPSFANAIQNANFGTEEQDLGPYYPAGCYMTATSFDAGNRCP